MIKLMNYDMLYTKFEGKTYSLSLFRNDRGLSDIALRDNNNRQFASPIVLRDIDDFMLPSILICGRTEMRIWDATLEIPDVDSLERYKYLEFQDLDVYLSSFEEKFKSFSEIQQHFGAAVLCEENDFALLLDSQNHFVVVKKTATEDYLYSISNLCLSNIGKECLSRCILSEHSEELDKTVVLSFAGEKNSFELEINIIIYSDRVDLFSKGWDKFIEL